MEYTIGQFSKLLGLNAETLRHYERSGVLGSRRDPKNQYRMYAFEDILPVLSVRQQRSIGMSLADVEAVFNGMTLQQQLEWVEEKERSIDAEIERLTHVKDTFHRFYQRLERSGRSRAENPVVVQEELPNAYQLKIVSANGEQPLYQKDLIKKWIDEIYFTHIMILIENPFSSGDGPMNISVGLGVLERVQRRIQLPMDEGIFCAPAGPGIAMMIKTANPFSFQASDFQPILEWRTKLGLPPDCRLTASVDNVTYENGGRQYYLTFRNLLK